MTMANSKSLQKKLLIHLYEHYTQQEVDQFKWHVDKEDDSSYMMDFVDHNENRKNLILSKQTYLFSLKDVTPAWS
jgi:hypothetical protein